MKILYFASLREQLGTGEEVLTDLGSIRNTDELLSSLKDRGEPWSSALQHPQLIIAVNQEVADSTTQITLHDEVAFFPPVTGG